MDVDKRISGPVLTLDPARERFTSHFTAQANNSARGDYRKPFLVPDWF